MKRLPARILFEIGVLRSQAIETRRLVSVYGEAERIRRGNPDDNFALEDIAGEIMAQCRDAPGFELDPFEAQGALMGSLQTLH